MTRILISLSIFFMFTSGLQAQIFGGWFRGYNNNYYNNGYYRNYQQPQQQQVQQSQQQVQQSQQQVQQSQQQVQQSQQQQSTQSQYKENTLYRFSDGSYRILKDGEWQMVDINEYVFNPSRMVLLNDEIRIIGEVNLLRKSLGLPMLVVSPSLMNTSRAQTTKMKYYGMQHWLVVQVMENIASGVRSGLHAFNMWLGSPGHYANMTNRSIRYIGVGCSGGYAAQQFTSSDRTPYQLVSEKDIRIQEEKIKAEEEAKAKAQEEAAATEEAPVVEEEAPVVEEETSATEEAPAVEEDEAPAVEEEASDATEELPTLIFEDDEEAETHESSVPGFKVVCKDGVCELVPVDEEENSSESTESNSADNQE